MNHNAHSVGQARARGGFGDFVSSPWILPALLLIGTGVRLAVILLIPVEPMSDALWYFNRAQDLAAGRGYQEGGHPTAYWPVGYPGFLAGLFAVFGSKVIVAQIANVVLWAGTLIVLHRIVSQISGRAAAGNLAAILYSLHLNAVGYSALLLTEQLYTFLLLLSLWTAVVLKGRGGSIALGLVLGAMTLVKAQTWLFGIAWAVLFLMLGNERRLSARFVSAALMALLMFTVVLPWSVRNTNVLGSFVLVSTNGGLSFAVGNHPNGTGTDAWEANPFRAEIGQSVADQVAADRRAKEITWRWIRENPGDFLALAPKKFYWALVPDGESEWGFQSGFDGYEEKRKAFRLVRWVNQLIYFTLAASCLLGVWALFAGGRVWREEYRAILLASVAYLSVFAAITFMFNGQSRYHYPIVPLMCAWAAIAWWQRLSSAAPRDRSESSKIE